MGIKIHIICLEKLLTLKTSSLQDSLYNATKDNLGESVVLNMNSNSRKLPVFKLNTAYVNKL